MTVFSIIAIVGVFIAIQVWARTKRPGAVAAVLVGAFIIAAMASPQTIQAGGQAVGKLITKVAPNITSIFGI